MEDKEQLRIVNSDKDKTTTLTHDLTLRVTAGHRPRVDWEQPGPITGQHLTRSQTGNNCLSCGVLLTSTHTL